MTDKRKTINGSLGNYTVRAYPARREGYLNLFMGPFIDNINDFITKCKEVKYSKIK